MSKGKKNIGFIVLIAMIIIIAIVGIVALVLNTIFLNKSLEKPGEELGFDIFIGDENMPVTFSSDEEET